MTNPEMNLNPVDKRKQFMFNLEDALEGHLDAHVWRSDVSRWTNIEFTEPGADVPEGSVLSESFKRDINYVYGGVMSPDEIQERLETMHNYQGQK